MSKHNNTSSEPILPSSEILEIFERINTGEKHAQVIQNKDLSNIIQAVIHYLDQKAFIEFHHKKGANKAKKDA